MTCITRGSNVYRELCQRSFPLIMSDLLKPYKLNMIWHLRNISCSRGHFLHTNKVICSFNILFTRVLNFMNKYLHEQKNRKAKAKKKMRSGSKNITPAIIRRVCDWRSMMKGSISLIPFAYALFLPKNFFNPFLLLFSLNANNSILRSFLAFGDSVSSSGIVFNPMPIRLPLRHIFSSSSKLGIA